MLSYKMRKLISAQPRRHFTLNHVREMLPFHWHKKLLLVILQFFFRMQQQIERQRMEQAAQAGRANTMHLDAEQHISSLEGMVQNAKAKTEEHAQRLPVSISTVNALEGEALRLQQTVASHCEEIAQLNRSNEETKES